MTSAWFIPFVLQGAAIAADELLFHRTREVSRWEKVGHALDTLSLLACLSLALMSRFTPAALGWYIGLGIVSSLLITKDEFLHARACGGPEHWLHAILFLLHPLVLLGAIYLWREGLSHILWTQWFGVLVFFSYQVAIVLRAWPEIDNRFYDDLGERWYTAQEHPVALLRAESECRLPWVLEEIGAAPCRVLDIGCGAGFLANALAQAGHEVTGVDLSEPSLAVARRHDRTGRVRYLRADALDLPFQPGQFDVVCAMDFLEHIEDPAQLIRSVSGLLRPGGKFFFHTFSRNLLSWLVVIKGVEWFVRNTPPHMHVYRLLLKPREAERICRNHGLALRSLRGVRPKIGPAFWKLIATGSVPSDFRFVFSSVQALGYSGMAVKAGGGARVSAAAAFAPVS